MLVTIVSFFAVLLVLILAHELGHFVTAKAFKVKVEEFGIFLPPRIVSFKKGETVYSLNAIPIGGFNRLAGEEDPKVPLGLAGKSIPLRILVLGAGSLMNLLLPLVLLSIAFMVPHHEITDMVIVEEVAPNSPARQAGIQPGDIILAVNGEKIAAIDDYRQAIDLNLGKEVAVELKHSDGTIVEVRLTPREQVPQGEGATGVAITQMTISRSYPFWQAIPHGAIRYYEFLVLYKDGIIATVSGAIPFEVAGPVGIAQATGEVAKMGINPLLQFAAFISINLGIVNIFPIPALDGGRIVFVLIEWVRRGKRVSPKTERLIHTIGFLLLMATFLVISYRDIGRWISGGGSLIP